MKIYELVNLGIGNYGKDGTPIHESNLLKIYDDETPPPSGGVNSVTGDGVGGTATDVVLTYPTPAAIGANAALGTDLNAAITGAATPSAGNVFVTVSALNSYAYVQEAPNDGKAYVRKSNAWAQLSPYDLKQEGATDGQALVWSAANSRYQPGTVSGGGGGNYIAYDVAQALTGLQRQQASDNIGASAGSAESFSNSGVVTVNNLVISKSNLYFTGSSTVTLTGIVALWVGQEVTIYNETGNDLTISPESGSSSIDNRLYNGLVLPHRSATKIKFVPIGSGSRWVNISSPFLFNQAVFGSATFSPVGFNRASENLVSAVFKTTTNTTGSVAIRARNSSDAILFEVTGSTIRANTGVAIGDFSPDPNLALELRPLPGYSLVMRISNAAGSSQIDVRADTGNWQSKGGAFYGSNNTGLAPTGRVDIRGVGTTTGNTLLLEDSAGTDNVYFIDNGQIRFLRIPTSSAGLPAGSVYRNGNNLEIV